MKTPFRPNTPTLVLLKNKTTYDKEIIQNEFSCRAASFDWTIGLSLEHGNVVKSGELPCDLRVNERRWLCNVAALQCVPSPALMALPCLLSCCMYLDRWGRGQPTLPRGVSAVEVKQKTDFHETQIAPNYKFNLNDKIFGPAVLRTRLLVSVYQVLVTTVKKQLRQDVRKSLCEPQKKHHSSTAVL